MSHAKTTSLYTWNNKKKRHNSDIFPDIFRCLIIGESSAGKTCLLFKLLLDNYLDYNHLLIVGDSLYQENYKILKQMYDKGHTKEKTRKFFQIQNIIQDCDLSTEQIIDSLDKNSDIGESITVEYYDSSDKIPDPTHLENGKKYLIIFDDVVTNHNQNVMKSYFTRGRHKNAIVFYLSQSYFALDRRAIRMNSNVLILFKLSNSDLKNLWQDRCQNDFTEYKDFKIFCNNVWKVPYNFVMINFNNSFESGSRYRTNID
jgi:hypothetical protein